MATAAVTQARADVLGETAARGTRVRAVVNVDAAIKRRHFRVGGHRAGWFGPRDRRPITQPLREPVDQRAEQQRFDHWRKHRWPGAGGHRRWQAKAEAKCIFLHLERIDGERRINRQHIDTVHTRGRAKRQRLLAQAQIQRKPLHVAEREIAAVEVDAVNGAADRRRGCRAGARPHPCPVDILHRKTTQSPGVDLNFQIKLGRVELQAISAGVGEIGAAAYQHFKRAAQ